MDEEDLTMTEKPEQYSVAQHPDLSFAKIPHEEGMTYEFDLRTKVAPMLKGLFTAKASPLPPEPGYEAPKRGAVFDFFFHNSGHVFFNLAMKKDGKVIGQRQIGFSADRTPDPAEAQKIRIGVPGYVFDEEKRNPSYHFNKTFPLSREQFDNVVGFVEENIKNPPVYHWPVAMNCVRFAKRAAKAAGIPNASLAGVFNLPVSTQVYMAVSKASERLEKAAEKQKRFFSSTRPAPVPEKKEDGVLRAALKKKGLSR